MREVELWTAIGHEAPAFVATVDIPPFPDKGMPQVIIWGDRTFTVRETQPADARWGYREVFCVVSLTPSPGKPRQDDRMDPDLTKTEERIVHGPKVETIHGTPLGEHTELKENGQQKDYIVLSERERAKGFVRPVRDSYVHVGPKPRGTLRDLTPEEQERTQGEDYVKYDEYPKDGSSAVGRYWTRAEYARFLNPCAGLTTMGRKLAETYAREPGFYSGTFCSKCGAHFPVGARGEFVWDGTSEKVGT